jgi:hypothetical protein
MKTTTTHHGKFDQSCHTMTQAEWIEFRKDLVSQRNAGTVSGWTAYVVPSGIQVRVTRSTK